ncbi:TIGR01212 family radical SAM protein [Fusibacter ferrireducens]|uniref:TIGR01212 family radical SAM protein n=1 Tax=Fusibacter ferrireducens TaxID=2785058 RepID=A0ABR9ZRJ0_9FIRM|nr:TIGR01212 family radical SAM protein [Fusibacter ferrireducens]MBF4692763.1 TIGR01212 family radical SAM protein [Fusibacter ferrireducens]
MKKAYYTLNDYFKDKFHTKIVKLSLDGGFTCPNRDGTLDTRGCLFCSELGSGEFAGDTENVFKRTHSSIEAQISAQKTLLKSKWEAPKYMSYFQNYSNTYKPVDELKWLYETATRDESILGLAVATRPDCISDEVIDLFESYNEKGIFWVELGLQSIHEKTVECIRRHYSMALFESVYQKLLEKHIDVVLHIILGLPGEDRAQMLDTVAYVSALKPFGVKFHMLNVLKGSDLETLYRETGFHVLTQEEYVELVCDALEILDSEIVVHRVTGDGPKELLIAPQWIKNKRAVLNDIDKVLRCRGTYQGIYSSNKG